MTTVRPKLCANPKVVTSQDDRLLYMSRGRISSTKQFQCNSTKEEWEDFENLRILKTRFQIQMINLKRPAIAVDVPRDAPRVEAALTTTAGNGL